MKRCPKCNRSYQLDKQRFCTYDGGMLVPIEVNAAETIISEPDTDDAPTKVISKDLVPEDVKKFDPFKTTIDPALREEMGGVHRRATEDLTPQSRPLPVPPASAPLPPRSESMSQSLGEITAPSMPAVSQASTQQQTAPPSSQPGGSISKPLTEPAVPPSPSSGPVSSAPLPAPGAKGLSTPQFSPQPQPVKGWEVPAPPPKKRSKAPLIIAILAVLFILFVAVIGVAYIFVVKPKLAARRIALIPAESPKPQEESPAAEATPAHTGNINVTTPPALDNEPPAFVPPENAVQFVNSNANLDGKLAEHYVDFSFYYPNNWQKDPKSGVAGASNFAKVERRLPPDFTQENFAVGWYSSSGSIGSDRDLFPTLAENLSSQFEKNFPEYHRVSEGQTKVGTYEGYEFRFEAFSRNTAKGDIKIWGRTIFLSPPDGGKNGLTLLMLTTSLAPELHTVEDVGEKGELPMILASFRFGKKE